jgi:hypothetical protein
LLLGGGEGDVICLTPLGHDLSERLAAKGIPGLPEIEVSDLILESTKCPAPVDGIQKLRPDIITLRLMAKTLHDAPFMDVEFTGESEKPI